MNGTYKSGPTPTNRIFSGVQPTGNLHLGNYLGAIRNWVRLQADYECVFCVVDMHAITIKQDPVELKNSIREVTAAYIACGIDPEKNILFNQSQNHSHAELAWIFNCVARMGWLNRMTQFKEKAGKNRENASTGLFVYPNLMAADILAYRATHVPVGEDQKQHLELTRDIATKFNNDFEAEDFFPLPEPVIMDTAARIMSLRDGTKKMSKSDPSEYSRINVADGPDEIAQKLRKAKTDPEPLPTEAEGLEDRPEAKNLIGIYGALSDLTMEETLKAVGGKQFKDFKTDLTDLAVSVLGPIGDEMKRLMADPAHLDGILCKGGEDARKITQPIMQDVYDIIGFVRPE
ncbi:tryptophan--tRNA ligase [Aestuariispira insulae]|uniref:Tryptophan--tRNA ligase n=1 Tax=Aestuariispira insulae TaxID=1461337 RepID=A0A3D9HPJ9_9PROT|nr:tryptophan--tRNA ligase [Aestuariispira insulae]RED51400.1 tryptophanyl-tRNA synthetase [Aestuariispira insulae]